MGKASNYLAFDLGAESGRGIIGAFDGKKIKLKEVYRFGHTPLRFGGTLRWDVLLMTHHLRQALGLANEQLRGEIISLGVDTWGVDYVLLDQHDQLIGYPYHYRDARTDKAMEDAWKVVARDQIYDRTGLAFNHFNTLYQLFETSRNNPQLLEMARSLLFMPDFLSYSLGGQKACEYTIASTSQMLDAGKRTWDQDLCAKMGIPTHYLMPLTQPGSVTGKLNKETQELTGAPGKVKVVAVGAHDTASAVAAVPTDGKDGNWAFLSSGTWSLFGAEMDQPVITAEGFAANFTNEGGVEGKIRLLKNIMGLWLVQELRRGWADRKGNMPDYASLTQAAAEAKPFGPVVNANWGPFGKPGKMAEKFVAYCQATGQKPPRTQGEFVRCALESLALAYRSALDDLQTITGKAITRVHIVGGGTKNQLLNQLAADACDREVLAGPEEATALGNLLMQMLADKKIKTLDEGRQIIRASFRLNRYRPNHTAQWADAYAFYKKLEKKTVRAKF